MVRTYHGAAPGRGRTWSLALACLSTQRGWQRQLPDLIRMEGRSVPVGIRGYQGGAAEVSAHPKDVMLCHRLHRGWGASGASS